MSSNNAARSSGSVAGTAAPAPSAEQPQARTVRVPNWSFCLAWQTIPSGELHRPYGWITVSQLDIVGIGAAHHGVAVNASERPHSEDYTGDQRFIPSDLYIESSIRSLFYLVGDGEMSVACPKVLSELATSQPS
jgi:hypothetical protein